MTGSATCANLWTVRFGLFWRLALILFLFYMTLRGQFLFWNRSLFVDESFRDLAKAFWVGSPFDIVAVSWTLIPVIIWGWFIRKAYWIPFFLIQIPLWVINVIDMELWKFWGRRMTVSSLDILKEGQGKAAGIAGDYVFWIGVAVVIGSLFWAAFWWVFQSQRKYPFQWKFKLIWAQQVLIILILALGARGGFQKKPLTPVNADHFMKSQMNQLSLNTTFMLLKSFHKVSIQRENFYPYTEAVKMVNGGITTPPILPKLPWTTKPNVVILIMESFSWEYTGLNPHAVQSYTPFLDELMKKSLSFNRGMANGRRSIEGVAAILSGIPALMEEPFITSEFSTNQFEGLGSVFTRQGYDSSFYHGGGNGTMHFDAFTLRAGFQHYFGSDQYPNQKENDGVWGIYDRPYLQYFSQELSKKKEPFVSALFTLTSHQPYKMPLGESFHAMRVSHPILRAISYADSSLKDFFATAEKEPWYQNTLFVIVADHTGPQVFSEFEDKIAAYRIPIVFFHPQIAQWPQEIDRDQLAQQIDIPASLYDLLGFQNEKTVALSRSVFRPGPRTFTAYIPGLYLQTDGKTVLLQQSKNNSYIDFENFRKAEPEDSYLEKSLKAVKQVFSSGLWDNALYF